MTITQASRLKARTAAILGGILLALAFHSGPGIDGAGWSDVKQFLLGYEGRETLEMFKKQAREDRATWGQSLKAIREMLDIYQGDAGVAKLQTIAELSLPHGTEGDLLLHHDPQPGKTVVFLANGESATWFDIYDINPDGSLKLRGEYNFGLRQDAFSIAEAPDNRVVIAGRKGVDVIDISDLDHPVHMGRWDSPKGKQARTEHLVFAVDVVESEPGVYAFVTVRRRAFNDNNPVPYNDDTAHIDYNVTGVHVLDLTNPSRINHVGAQGYLDLPGTESYVYRNRARYAGRDIVVDRSTSQVLVANGDSGVHVFKYDPVTFLISETEKWVYDVGENPDPSNSVRNFASELSVSGAHVFVAAGRKGLLSLERRENPDRLVELDSLAGAGVHGLSIDTIPGEPTLLLGVLRSCDADRDGDCNSPEQGGLRAVHISNPSNLLLDSSIAFDFPLAGRASGSVSVLYNNTHSNERVYVESDWHVGFLYDIDLTTNSGRISKNEIIPISGEAQSLHVHGNHAYVGDSSYVISIDISEPRSPAFVGFFHTQHYGGYFGKLDGWNTNLYLHQKNRISVADISNDDGLLVLEELVLEGENGTRLSPPYELFCIDDGRFWLFTRPGKISVFDLTGGGYDKPSHIATGDLSFGYDFGTQYNHVACEKDRFYMLTNEARGRKGMRYGLIVAELQESSINVHFTPDNELKLIQDQRVSLAVDGNTLYTNNGLRGNLPNDGLYPGLTVIDVADPGNPFVRKRLESRLWSNTGLHLDRQKDVLFAQSYSGFDSGVKVFDVSDPNSPRVMAAEDINILNIVNTDYSSRGWLPGVRRGGYLYSAKLAQFEVFDLNPECTPCPYSYCQDGQMCMRNKACDTACCEYACSLDVNCAADDPTPRNACPRP